MGRIAQRRPAATPASAGQAARRQAILRAAAELGAEAEFDRVQMADLANRAGVALGTLYRYFPTKTEVFATLFQECIATFVADQWRPPSGADVLEQIGRNLAALNATLLRSPRLCSAMLRATAAAYMGQPPPELLWLESESALTQAILDTLGVEQPNSDDHGTTLLLIYSWWGVLTSSLSRRMSPDHAERELCRAASLILANYVA
ncbi:TetR family transcriptional regulator [Nocardia tenerifensis]|uniref:TetR family transcriptional regulator n=1 Tax=Nocardia tenerifensis TaxID=228006 RepID=A0A318JYA4_9NOCA|nr:TetR/AcrR family transcriptional regulator [Nocardia tenerifensis]PXX61749.1 TetR family transcriptional regulator [Nocardia tenerifensis]